MSARRLAALTTALCALAACSSGGSGGAEARGTLATGSTAPAMTASTPSTAGPIGALPDSGVHASFERNGQTATWYQSDGYYVIALAGARGALCVKAGLDTGSRVESTSQAATESGACAGEVGTAPRPGHGLRSCDAAGLLFLTDVPVTASGSLTASLLTGATNGHVSGAATSAPANAAAAPVIDVHALGCRTIT